MLGLGLGGLGLGVMGVAMSVTSAPAFAPHALNESVVNVSASMGSAINTELPKLITYHGGTPSYKFEFIGASGLEQFWELPQESGIDARAELALGNTKIFVMSDMSGGIGDQTVISYGVKWLDLANQYGADPYFYKIWNSSMPGSAGASWAAWYQESLYRRRLWNWVVNDINAGRRPGTRPMKVIPFNDVHIRVYEEILNGTAPAELLTAAAANGAMMLFHGAAGTYTDGHPSEVGRFVIATTAFCTIYQRQSTMPFASMFTAPAKSITEATATWLRNIIWEIVQAEPLNGFGGDGWTAPEYGVRADALDSITVYKAPAGATSFDLRNQAGVVTNVAAATLPQTIPLALGGHDNAIEIKANNSANWATPINVLTQGTSPVQIVAMDWYDTAGVSTGLTVTMPTGLQDGDIVAFIGVVQNNLDGIWANPGDATKPAYYALVPNRIISKIAATDSARRVSMNCSWGVYNSATWPASFDKMGLIAYCSFCVLVLRGASSFALGATGQRSVASPGPTTVTNIFDYPALTVAEGSLLIDMATGRHGTGAVMGMGNPQSMLTLLQHVNPTRLDETVLKKWRYNTHIHTTTMRVAKTTNILAETREFPGYSYIQTGVFRFVAAP
ncbi:hypothetical protein C8J30_108142 [Rhodobacter viridis]|uniref:Uncharacterized protein n=2 Tax=Rhodobacter viridis TaxID=1054202 RepID=A0A318TYZ5_9RHOB|nr:hypothetical protein C8J30_108142 [Rhodobacter viridis]